MAELKKKFPTMFHSEHLRTAQNLSNPYEDVYVEYPPYAKDEKGAFINPSSVPKLVKSGRINIQEKIQSYADDVDIYRILERMALQGQLMDQVAVSDNVVDFSNVPDNINDFSAWVRAQYEDLTKLPKELSSLLIKDDFNPIEFDNAVKSYYAKKEEKKEDNSSE